ncbi:MAG TPA: pyrroline-5-carboxylate reductase [Lachnospiraceae bacterium]|nr:pyrroline-5-carboxylate reductase [Lachnospiraceae bacterium]
MKAGFIGSGNMGGAMMRGILASGKCTEDEIMASDAMAGALTAIEKELGIRTSMDNKIVASFADVLFLAVKPQYYQDVIEEIRDVVTLDKVVVTIAPGKTLEWLQETFVKPVKIIRTMPNTPAMVREGMMGICPGEYVSKEDIAMVRDICSGFSNTEIVGENLMDVVTAVSGSSPAFVFMFIEAMADAAVAEGMPRAQAYKFAAQAVLGSAKMVLDTGKHPGELKDMVCSPGGTTIEAVRVLEEKGLRSAVFEAVKACADKSRGM